MIDLTEGVQKVPRPWAVAIALSGWALLAIAVISPFTFGGESIADRMLPTVAVGLLLLTGLSYLVGRGTFLKRYDRIQLSWVFAPHVTGLVLALVLVFYRFAFFCWE